MEIGSLLMPLEVHPVAGRREVGARAAQRRPVPAEHVLHGELLEKQRAQARERSPQQDPAYVQGSRREDHPAFQRRFANETYMQRQAVRAYQGNAVMQGHAPGRRPSIDYFV